MRTRTVLTALAILGCAALVMAQTTNLIEVKFVDENGALLTGQNVAVISHDRAIQKLPATPDGIYIVPAQEGQKIGFIVDDPVSGSTRVEAVVPTNLSGPLGITVPSGAGTDAPPDNDLCDDAIPVGVPSITAGTNVEATIDSEQPFCGTSITSPGVWYEVVGTGNTMVATTCDAPGQGGSADYDTKISVYCKDCDDATCIGGNDDSCSGGSSFLRSTVTWCSQAGATYHVLVHAFGGQTGNFELSIFDGASCDDAIQCLPEGACCSCLNPPFDCTITTHAECAATGSTYKGDDTDCLIPFGNVTGYVAFPNLPIPDSNSAGISHTINVPDSLTIADVNVDLGITHTWIGDLIISVEHNGVSQEIWTRQCSSFDNIQATADDQGIETLCSVISGGPIDGVFFPPDLAGQGPLSVFHGMDQAGDWTITVSDNAFLDTGTLDQWSVHFDEDPGQLLEICAGHRMITICHASQQDPNNRTTIRIAEPAVDMHLENHEGDYMGTCVEPGPTMPTSIVDQPSRSGGTFGR